MKGRGRFFALSAFFFLALSVSLLAPPASAAPSDVYTKTGEIRGVLDYCAAQGSGGIEVFIPGSSFAAQTDASGNFRLSFVGVGTHILAFEKNGQRLGAASNVVVAARTATFLNADPNATEPYDLSLNPPPPVVLCTDIDGDGFDPSQDCNDANPMVYPGAPELCGDGLDNNCDGLFDESCLVCTDIDGDGFYAQVGCGIVDCDETSAAINPGALESCGDGIDNNCDGQVDEDTAHDAITYYRDNDGDGYGAGLFDTVTACNAPQGYVFGNDDCDDTLPGVHPNAIESCNGEDDDCDGNVDENCIGGACSAQEMEWVNICTGECGGNADCVSSCLADQGVSEACIDAIYVAVQCVMAHCAADPSDYECIGQFCQNEWESAFGPLPIECVGDEWRECGSSVGQCTSGIESCTGGYWSGLCEGSIGSVPEVCDDGLDNDCNGYTDDCVECPPDQIDCGEGYCVDLANNPSNCGACGSACDQGDACVSGVCVLVAGCSSPTDCDDGNVCTINYCDAELGCISERAPVDTPCGDGGYCDGEGECFGAICSDEEAGVIATCALQCGGNYGCTYTCAQDQGVSEACLNTF